MAALVCSPFRTGFTAEMMFVSVLIIKASRFIYERSFF
jgi:hypothetical protein